MEAIGETWTVDQFVTEALKDKLFFQNSGGGVTFSGGEPLKQAAFVIEAFVRLKKEGISTALDTCGYLLRPHIEELLPCTDLFLYDIKEMNNEQHRRWTGVSNEPILENLIALVDLISQQKKQPDIWIRTPLIPQRTASRENILAIGEFIKKHLGGRIRRWELCAFNNICAQKYARLEQPWALSNETLLGRDLSAELLDLAKKSSGMSEQVFLTGLA